MRVTEALPVWQVVCEDVTYNINANNELAAVSAALIKFNAEHHRRPQTLDLRGAKPWPLP